MESDHIFQELYKYIRSHKSDYEAFVEEHKKIILNHEKMYNAAKSSVLCTAAEYYYFYRRYENSNKNKDIFHYLLEGVTGHELNSIGKRNPLMLALIHSDYIMADLLLKLGANINQLIWCNIAGNVAEKYKCPLINEVLSSFDNKRETAVIELLTYAHKNGADFNVKGQEPLIYRCMQCFWPSTVGKLIDFLLQFDFDPHYVNSYGKSILMQVVNSNGTLEIIQKLVDRGADIHYVCKRGIGILIRVLWSRESLFKSGERRKIINYLLENGVDVNQVSVDNYDNDNKTSPLDHVLFEVDDTDIMESLLKRGAKSAAYDNSKICITNEFMSYIPLTRTNGKTLLYVQQTLNHLQVLYNYFGVDYETRYNVINQMTIDSFNRSGTKGGLRKALIIGLRKIIESWEPVCTLRTMCLRIVKTGQAGDDYKDFAPGYFEWWD